MRLMLLFFSVVAFGQGFDLEEISEIRALNDSSRANVELIPGMALLQALEAIDLAYELKYAEGHLVGFQNAAYAYKIMLKYDSALLYLHRAKDLAVHENDSTTLSEVYNELGSVYYGNKQFLQAETNYLISFEMSKTLGDDLRMARSIGNLGIIASVAFKDFDKALMYFEESLRIHERLEEIRGQGTALNNIAAIHFMKEEYDETIRYNNRSLNIALATDNQYQATLSYENLGEVYQITNQYDSALYFYHKLLSLADELSLSDRIGAAHKRISSLYADRGLFKEAYHQLLIYDAIRDSLTQLNMTARLTQMESQLDEQVSRQRINLLEAENALSKEKVIHQQFQRLILGVATFVLILLVIVLILQLRQNKRKSLLLERKTQELSAANAKVEIKNTALSNTVEKLESTQNQLVESEKMASLGILTGGIAHELNNPLNFISGAVQPLRQNLDEIEQQTSQEAKESFEDIEELLGLIDAGAKRAVAIVRNLLSISPRNRNSSVVNIQLVEMIESRVRTLQKDGNLMSFHLDIDEDIHIMCNPDELNQVMLNVIRNAADAIEGKRKGLIEIAAKIDGKMVAITVKDNGEGMDKESEGRVFEPFFTTKDPGYGAGLGLYVARSVVAKYGGSINVQNNEGAGCLATVRLPLSELAPEV